MPTQQRGSSTGFRMFEEATFGTFPASPQGLALPYIDSDLSLSQDLVESNVLMNTRNPQEPVPNEKTVSGGFTMQPDVRSIGHILKHLLGTVNTTIDTPTAGINTHEFTVSDLPVGLSFEKWLPSIPISMRYFGCKIQSLSLDLAPGGLLTCRVDVMGMDESATETTQADATVKSYVVRAFRLPIVTLSEGGSGMTIATRFSMNITNNLEEVRTIGNQGRIAALNEGIVRATGSMSVLFQDMTLYNKAKNQTASALILTFPASDPVADQSLAFKFDEVKYSINSPDITGPGGMIVDFNWQAYVATGTSAAKATLINDVVSYATIPAS